ncbi:sugar ABC transporter substrate-binding protein [Bacillus sp. J14TS2]|uniref:extracellular solute-binding protein n=1 Tax=Bacillus sp. J14TS2 TaxID=2807188 RepID=UPI001B166958|nr:extracellular solute-binding protein [Bacillus sp. J14TS2]GIN71583.1 sugar ABC transporter substrate-binding protein [Bacillus sp. J14TS2]
MKIKILFTSLLLVIAISLVGCSNNSEDGDGITLTMMNNWSIQSPEFDIYQERIEQFEKENPDIKIKQDKVPAADYMTKLRTLATGGNLPDLAVVWPEVDLHPLVEGGVIQPLEDMSKWEDLILEEYLEGYEVDGENYAIPTKVNSMSVIYYNKEYLQQVGYSEFPKTYSELLELVSALEEDGITPIGVGNKPKWPLQSSYLSVIADRITGSDYLADVLNGEKKFTDEEFVSALEVVEELVEKNAFNEDINSIDAVQIEDNFLQGKSAMIMTSASSNARLRLDNENGDNVGIALFPEIENGKGNTLASPTAIQYGVAMNSDLDGEKKEAATKFLEFFFSEDLYVSLAEIGVPIPAEVDIDEDVDSKIVELLELTSQGISPVYDSVVSPELKTTLEDGLQAITTGQKSAEDVSKEMQEIVENQQ